MTWFTRRRRRRGRRLGWRHEPGPGYDLREYGRDGEPTGWIASVWYRRKPHEVFQVPGNHVHVTMEPGRITMVTWAGRTEPWVWLQIPFAACVDIQVHDEPGLVGSEPVRLELTVQFGPDRTVMLPMWFPAEQRAWLREHARHILRRHEPAPPPPSVATLPLLDVEQAPDTDDWVVFGADRSRTEMLRPRTTPGTGDPAARRNGETP
jgi:hypothetical protein